MPKVPRRHQGEQIILNRVIQLEIFTDPEDPDKWLIEFMDDFNGEAHMLMPKHEKAVALLKAVRSQIESIRLYQPKESTPTK